MAKWTWQLRTFVAICVASPSALLVARLISGDVAGYGWGWQMFST